MRPGGEPLMVGAKGGGVMRKLGMVLVVLVLLAGGGLYYLANSIDGIVASLIEKSGSSALGTTVRVSDVKISLKEAKGSIAGLTVANPSGFSGEAISFQDIVIGIDPASLLSRKPIVITEVTVRSPSVNLVLGANGSTNIQALLANVSGSSSKPAPSTDASAGSSDLRLRINRLEIADASLAADLSAVGGKNFSTKIPALRQSNVGGGSGAAPDALATTIAKVYVSKVGESVARAEAAKQVNKLVDKHLGGEAGEAAKGILGNILGQ